MNGLVSELLDLTESSNISHLGKKPLFYASDEIYLFWFIYLESWQQLIKPFRILQLFHFCTGSIDAVFQFSGTI